MEEKFKNGLVLGKFYPFTLGHKYLIDTALQKCNTVHVMICSLESESIPGEIRYEWLKETYKENNCVNVIWCHDELPQKPEECESVDIFYNKYWTPSVYSRIKELDVVFTSELYGDEFANYLGIKHVLVDLDRINVPVSGTSVRNKPNLMWEYIPNNVRQYYQKKIVIMGPESTGKSTITKKLSEHFKCEYIEEYGREYTDNIPAREMSIKDYENIAITHSKNILDKINKQYNFLFIDTEAITTKLFGELYLTNFKSDIIDEIIENQKFELYILLNIDVPWVDDGTRDFPNRRKEHYDMIKNELDKRKLPYIIINGESFDNRLEQAIIEVEKIKASF